ncbi:MAG: universal stress protein [Anabaena sp. CoA2_C59]|jgi:nucleotide-binding universal stress UspA family protein|uniref:Universal stress protein n=2 Tax=Aphanizomenon flos-aquae TaxID=1176 RepID=A0A1B7X3V7_APHFL|nr:universal stress protein [Aphanizomenon flos-aquae Clear-A1]MBO1042591.1 universal stress protein [Aphanizomenon flos-aquae UKL13-PB]MBO1062238.1 universal stress protein [Aphanizomenon flos-aquae CP01]MCE2905469.1 universal stress protein [Anabaena sp. CoA2_C59]MDJ0505959.1 universal stress protein [Nostocales cyanobacterium LE14-WE12]NTW18670.1 universal stress protein [Nostocales cyanobacterium W4_Combined_metabat2_030]OBQ18650.1 MAG: universal stress protein [Aphanizomenon flos-aquae L
MFNKILAAVDRSDMSIKVFEQALSLAKITSANLMLLHILSQEEEGSPEALIYPNIDYYPGWNEQSFKLYQEHWDKFKNEGLQMLQSWSAQANTSGVNTEFTQNTGSPGRMICELATSWDADLIIMGRRGRSGLAEFFLGSVSNYVLHHAPCSVQIVHLPMSSQAAEVTSKTTTFSN